MPPFAACLLLAQASPDPLSGGAAWAGSGWTGAGLLGLVLVWLLFWHLPARDKQTDALLAKKDEQLTELIDHFNGRIEKKDEQLDDQRAEFTATLAAITTAERESRERLTAAFKAEASAERQSCEKHYATLATSMSQAFKMLGDQLAKQAEASAEHSRRNQQWIDLMKKDIEVLLKKVDAKERQT